jgi:hypothetical protein
MKFPKSMHAEGWDQHFEGGAPAVKTNNPAFNQKRGFKAGAKPVSLHTPWHADAPARIPARELSASVAAPARASSAAPEARPAAAGAGKPPASPSSSLPWVLGAGVGVLLIGGAVAVSRSLAPAEPAATQAPMVVGQVTPSAEDAQLQSSPPSAGLPAADEAGPAASVGEASAPPVMPAPKAVTEPQAAPPAPAETRVAQGPMPRQPQPQVWTAKPADKADTPAPVVRTLTPAPEVLAQASPPATAPVALAPVPPQAAAPVTAPAPAPAATTATVPTAPNAASAAALPMPPAATAPVTPPVIAQQAPTPASTTPDPADTSITVQVRQALAADATLAAVPIAVSTDHGVVKLEGQAPDVQARERATVVAANTVGVKAVDNRLTLPPVAAVDRGPISQGV